jgi:predicted membrane protein
MTNDTFDSTCLRHPDTASNLGCSRCGDLICPQCMVQSPVGARCPDCANIGQAPIFRSTRTEFASAIVLALVAAIGFGVAYAVVVWVLWVLPLGFMIGNVAASFIIALAGAPVGDFVRRVGKNKLDARLRIVAAVTMLLIWMVGFTVGSMLGVWNGVFLNIVAYIGLGVGIYVAMNRVRP